MKVLKLKVSINKKEIVEYPRYDMGKISGLDPDIKFYYINESNKPEYNYNTHKLVLSETFVDEEPIGTYTKSWNIEQLSNDQIIINLNNSLGNHLDTLYPEWERSKHAGESLRFILKGQENWDNNDLARIQYIEATANWARDCRLERDNREQKLLINGIIPSFVWESRPSKI